MKYGLPDTVIDNICAVFARHSKVDKAIIFGSRAKGNFKPGSDIDLAIKGASITLGDILSISAQLENLNLPYKIDLINYLSVTDPDVTEHINRAGIEFYIKK